MHALLDGAVGGPRHHRRRCQAASQASEAHRVHALLDGAVLSRGKGHNGEENTRIMHYATTRTNVHTRARADTSTHEVSPPNVTAVTTILYNRPETLRMQQTRLQTVPCQPMKVDNDVNKRIYNVVGKMWREVEARVEVPALQKLRDRLPLGRQA